jgi:CO/xanthine dehydrogenase Mo-binding subunit
VRVQFMRWDEHGWDNYGPAQMSDVRGGVDAKGNIVATEITMFGIPWYTTKPTEAMIGYQQQFAQTANLDTTNNGTQYNLKNRRVIGKHLPVQNNYFKTIWLRAPAAQQTTFAYEQLIDELAHAANMDPVQFRLQNIATQASDQANGITALTWDRWKNVLTKAAEMAAWKPAVAASNVGSGNIVTGRGVALGSFAGTPVANIAEIQVNKKTGKITPLHLYSAQDTGLTVYPEGVSNQAVGSLIQGASRALVEELSFDKRQVTGLDWVTYPIMRFKDSPTISFEYLQRTDIPATSTGVIQPNGTTAPASTVAASGVFVSGSGEPPSTSIGAAIANALFDATGVRMRSAPLTPARVRAAFKAAGIS